MVSSSLILMRDVKIVSVGMVPYNVRGNSVIFLTAGTQYIHQGLAVLCVQVWLGSLFLFVQVFEKNSQRLIVFQSMGLDSIGAASSNLTGGTVLCP